MKIFAPKIAHSNSFFGMQILIIVSITFNNHKNLFCIYKGLITKLNKLSNAFIKKPNYKSGREQGNKCTITHIKAFIVIIIY